MSEAIVLVGGGGHSQSCIETIESDESSYRVAGVIDGAGPGTRILGYEVLGTDDDVPALIESGTKAFLIAIAGAEAAALREKLFRNILNMSGARFPVVVASTARVSRHAKLGQGTIVMHRAFVNALAEIGENCILNNACVIEHGAIVGDHTHIAPGAILNGECEIGARAFVGSGAVVLQRVSLAEGVKIGAGSVVNADLSEPGWYAGAPARRIDGEN